MSAKWRDFCLFHFSSRSSLNEKEKKKKKKFNFFSVKSLKMCVNVKVKFEMVNQLLFVFFTIFFLFCYSPYSHSVASHSIAKLQNKNKKWERISTTADELEEGREIFLNKNSFLSYNNVWTFKLRRHLSNYRETSQVSFLLKFHIQKKLKEISYVEWTLNSEEPWKKRRKKSKVKVKKFLTLLWEAKNKA